MGDQIELGAEGAENNQGAEGATVTPEVTNAGAKKLPWVQEALRAQAELVSLKQKQAEAKAQAERERAEAEGRYQDALKMEQDLVAEIKADYEAKVRQMSLENEFIKAGVADPRVVKIFADDYNPESESVAEFVSRVKSDESNQLYFQDTNTRRAAPPPPSGGKTVAPTAAELEKWSKSSDPEKRKRAIDYKREYWIKHGRLPLRG